MSDLKPIKAYVHSGGGPNPFKVLIILEELGLPYEKVQVEDPKADWFVAINPNGRLPAIEDPNSDITLWESGAILEYLVDTYDKEGRLGATSVADKWRIKQYLHFQMSGQGPYYGQAVWFFKAPEDIPLAKDRYVEQIVRVIQVLDGILEGNNYLLGDRITYADLAFVPWNFVIKAIPFFKEPLWAKYDIENKYTNYAAWHQRMLDRPSVKATYGL